MKNKLSVVVSRHPQRLVFSFTQGIPLMLLRPACLFLIAFATASGLQAQTCEHIPHPGSESISARITINGTDIPVTDGMVVPAWTPLRVDSIATATGSCTERAWTNTQPSSCEPTGTVWERHPNHTQVSVEISTDSGEIGFIVGYVYPTGPPNQHVINSASSDTTGPNTMYAAWKGVYKFHIYANINYTICNLAPYQTEEQIIRVEPVDLRNADGSKRYPKHPNGFDRGDYGHSATPRNDLPGTDRGGVIHVYANPQGLPGATDLYAPAGFSRITSVRGANGSAVSLIPGSNNRRFYRNGEGIVIAFVHVRTRRVSGIGSRRSDGSTRIGNIGGPGGDGNDYFHTHVAFYSQYFGDPETGVRIDPRKIFCKEFGF